MKPGRTIEVAIAVLGILFIVGAVVYLVGGSVLTGMILPSPAA